MWSLPIVCAVAAIHCGGKTSDQTSTGATGHDATSDVAGCPTCPAGMAPIAGGTYTFVPGSIGADAGPEAAVGAPVTVVLEPYYLDVTEVTTAAYAACVEKSRLSKMNGYGSQ